MGVRHVSNSNSSSSFDTRFQSIELSLRLILKARIRIELDLETLLRAEFEPWRSSSSRVRAHFELFCMLENCVFLMQLYSFRSKSLPFTSVATIC